MHLDSFIRDVECILGQSAELLDVEALWEDKADQNKPLPEFLATVSLPPCLLFYTSISIFRMVRELTFNSSYLHV